MGTWNFHTSAPVAASRLYMLPSSLPTQTRPCATTGEPTTRFLVAPCHSHSFSDADGSGDALYDCWFGVLPHCPHPVATGAAPYAAMGRSSASSDRWPGGVIALDNTLWGGAVAEPEARLQGAAKTLHETNMLIAADLRTESVLLPIGDGIHLATKL